MPAGPDRHDQRPLRHHPDRRRRGRTSARHVLKTERGFNLDAGLTTAHDRLPEFFTSGPVAPHNAVWDFSDEEIDAFWNF